MINVKDYGVVGDGVTDDTAAIQAVLDSAAGKTVYFPNSDYSISSTLEATKDGTQLVGESRLGSILRTTAANINMVEFSANYQGINEMLLHSNVVSDTPSAALVLNGSGDFSSKNLYTVGGYYGIYGTNNAYDSNIDGAKCFGSYGPALVYFQNASGNYVRRCKLDENWPVQVPVPANFKNAWAASTPYSVGDMVYANGIYMQCKVAGTSGTSTPTNTVPYYTDITDGTATWLRSHAVGKSSIWVDGDCFHTSISKCDLTGAFDFGLRISKTVGTYAPQKITMLETEIGAVGSHGVHYQAGSGIVINSNTIGQSGLGIGAGVYVNLPNASHGDIIVNNNLVYGYGFGVLMAGGKNLAVDGNNIQGCTVTGVHAISGVSDFSITNNQLGGGTWGTNGTAIRVDAGSSNNYIIRNNLVAGAGTGVIDLGTGGNKSVGANV